MDAPIQLPMQLIDSRGAVKKVEDSILGCVTSWNGDYIAFATVEGDLWLAARKEMDRPDLWQKIQPHDGGILCLSQDMEGTGFITAGEDNCLMHIVPQQEPELILKTKRWVEKIAAWSDESGKTVKIALNMGKQVHLYQNEFTEPYAVLDHDSTVSDLTFSLDGRKLATSHYNGATYWSAEKTEAKDPRTFIWKGSHIAIALHPQEEALVTSMQDHDLHGWRISDGHNMRMSGYPTKVRSLSFSHNGKWLATSGTESIIAWPFFDGGPMGKSPMELPGIPGSCCTRVQFHPSYEMVAAGFLDGSVMLVSPEDEKVIPVCLGLEKSLGEVTALQFSKAGDLLCFGTDTGMMAIIDLGTR